MRTVVASLLFLVALHSLPASAVYTELGVSYNYKKVTYDAANNTEQQGLTGSIAFYLWERVGLELAYTSSTAYKQEPTYDLTQQTRERKTIQRSNIYEANLQYLLTPDRKAMFQPFIKGGVAYISKKQELQIDNDFAQEVKPKPGFGPSIGVGMKVFFTESLSLRFGYDVVRTPIDENTTADDITGRMGISWIL